MVEGTAAERVHRLLLVGRLDDAECEARTGLAGAPQDPGLLAALAAVLLAAGRWDEGLDAAEAATAVAPQHADLHRLRGLLLSNLSRHTEAVAAAEAAVALAPTSAAAADHAVILLRAGRPDDARREARRAVARAPTWAAAHVMLAVVLAAVGDPRHARRSYGDALRLDPGNADARRGLALLDAGDHRFGTALAGLADAGVLDPASTATRDAVEHVVGRFAGRLQLWALSSFLLVAAAGPLAAPATFRLLAGVALLAVVVVIGVAVWQLPRRAWPLVRASWPTAVRPNVLPCLLWLTTLVVIVVTGVEFGFVALGLMITVGAGLWLALLGHVGLRVVRRLVGRRPPRDSV